MLLRKVLQLTDRLDADAVRGRGPRRRDRAAAPPDGENTEGSRRLLMVGARTDGGAWTWVAPEAGAAHRTLPGPWSLTLLLRGRPAGGSPP